MLENASGWLWETWGGLGKALGMLGECLGEAWGGLFYPRSASVGRLGYVCNAGECFGEASGGLGKLGEGLGNAL